jgi:hypothetical protein
MFPDGDRNSPPAAVCIGTSVATEVAVGTAVAAGALADGVAAADAVTLDAAPAADDVLGLQADSASPTPSPSAEMPTTLCVRAKRPKFITVPLIVLVDQT